MKVYMVTQGIEGDYPESLSDIELCATREIAERELAKLDYPGGFITEWEVLTK